MAYVYKFLSQSSFDNCHWCQDKTATNSFLMNTFWASMISILTYIPKTDCYIKKSQSILRGLGTRQNQVRWTSCYWGWYYSQHSQLSIITSIPSKYQPPLRSIKVLPPQPSVQESAMKTPRAFALLSKRIWINQTLTDCAAHILYCRASY